MLEYAKLFRFSQRQYDELSARLQRLERLLKTHDAPSVDELLQRAAAQGAALDAYFALEGQRGRLEEEAAALLRGVQRRAVELRWGSGREAWAAVMNRACLPVQHGSLCVRALRARCR